MKPLRYKSRESSPISHSISIWQILDTLSSRIMFQDIDLIKLLYECLLIDSNTTTVLSDMSLQLKISNRINIDISETHILSGHILFMVISIFSMVISIGYIYFFAFYFVLKRGDFFSNQHFIYLCVTRDSNNFQIK